MNCINLDISPYGIIESSADDNVIYKDVAVVWPTMACVTCNVWETEVII